MKKITQNNLDLRSEMSSYLMNEKNITEVYCVLYARTTMTSNAPMTLTALVYRTEKYIGSIYRTFFYVG